VPAFLFSLFLFCGSGFLICSETGNAPENPQALILQAQVYMKAGQYALAEETYRQALGLAPSDFRLLQNIGDAQWAQGEKNKAIESFRDYLRHNSNDVILEKWMNSQGYIHPDEDRWGPVWRSAVLPGWGQFYNDRPIQGYILGGTTIFSFVGTATYGVLALNAYHQAKQAEATYLGLGAGLSQSSYSTPYNQWANETHLNHLYTADFEGWGIAFAALYAVTLIDAAFDKQASPSGYSSIIDDTKVVLLPDKDGGSLALLKRW